PGFISASKTSFPRSQGYTGTCSISHPPVSQHLCGLRKPISVRGVGVETGTVENEPGQRIRSRQRIVKRISPARGVSDDAPALDSQCDSHRFEILDERSYRQISFSRQIIRPENTTLVDPDDSHPLSGQPVSDGSHEVPARVP